MIDRIKRTLISHIIPLAIIGALCLVFLAFLAQMLIIKLWFSL